MRANACALPGARPAGARPAGARIDIMLIGVSSAVPWHYTFGLRATTLRLGAAPDGQRHRSRRVSNNNNNNTGDDSDDSDAAADAVEDTQLAEVLWLARAC